MKITDITATYLAGIRFPVPLHPAWSPGTVLHERSETLVRVHTDDGIVGVSAVEGDARAAVLSARPYLVGKNPCDVERHVEVMRSIPRTWVLEPALWDIIGKKAGMPLSSLWGRYHHKMLAYASFFEVGTPEKRAEDAVRARDAGFRALKLRIHNQTMREDIALVEAVRKAVGDDVAIMVDANQTNTYPWPRGGPRWSYERARDTARELERLGCVWLEEPLERYDFEHIARLCDEVDIAIAGAENNRGLHEFKWMIEQGVYDILQPDAMVSEGLSQLRKIAAMAEAAHVGFNPHHGSTCIGLAAHLHLAATVPMCEYLEYFYDPPGLPIELFQGLV
jgi:D-galactarolactone cycloisomerase